MRKLALSLALVGMTLIASAQDIKLPKPLMENKVTLMEALQNRHSSREYSEKQITDSELSTVLWAACGINRPESGKLTVPSAINAQDIQVYVIRQDGAYLYQPKENMLKKVSSRDLRALVAGRQAFAATAPVSLVLVSDHTKFGKARNAYERLGVIDAGYVSQNICLACSALGLNTVPRMTMDTEGLRKELGLDSNYDIIINSQIGYPKTLEK
jgi:SagB-type dehydrogenase family enzyme